MLSVRCIFKKNLKSSWTNVIFWHLVINNQFGSWHEKWLDYHSAVGSNFLGNSACFVTVLCTNFLLNYHFFTFILQVEKALDVSEKLVRASPDELKFVASDLVRTLVQVRCSDLAVEGEEDSAEEKRQRTLVALLVTCPVESLETLNKLLYSPNVDVSQRLMILDVMTEGAQELADTKIVKAKHQTRALISTTSETQAWLLPSDIGPPGAGAWKEISETNSLLNWTNRYERELPPKPGQIRRGKTRQWSLRSANTPKSEIEWSHNKFPVYAAAFMLPAMQGFDIRRQGVDLLDRDFIVLGKLIYMLGVCMKCAAMHPEASALAGPLLDMLRSRY